MTDICRVQHTDLPLWLSVSDSGFLSCSQSHAMPCHAAFSSSFVYISGSLLLTCTCPRYHYFVYPAPTSSPSRQVVQPLRMPEKPPLSFLRSKPPADTSGFCEKCSFRHIVFVHVLALSIDPPLVLSLHGVRRYRITVGLVQSGAAFGEMVHAQ